MVHSRDLQERWRRFRGGVKTQEADESSQTGRRSADPALPPSLTEGAGRAGALVPAIPTPPAPLAAIDAGSNTIHLAVIRPAYDGHDLRILKDDAELTQLGADVTAIGAIGPERAAAAIVAIRAQVAEAQALGATTILGIATEGVRKAANAAVFLERGEAETGLRLRLITGEQEAALAYWGATSESPQIAGKRGVIDLGGGSLELIVGEGMRVNWRASLPLGGNIVRARFLPSDPPTFRELSQAYQSVTAALADLPALVAGDVSVCGGTATALAQMARRALGKSARGGVANGAADPSASADRAKAGAPALAGRRQRILTREQMDQLLTLTLRFSAAELAARYHLREARARLMAPGCVALLAATERFGVDQLRVSKRGIREGALLAYLHSGVNWLEAATSGQGWRTAPTQA